MASSSECIASSVIADQATLEQIREEEASFYGTSEEAVDSDMPTSDDDSDEVFLVKMKHSPVESIRICGSRT